jgi:hypothetical protein
MGGTNADFNEEFAGAAFAGGPYLFIRLQL